MNDLNWHKIFLVFIITSISLLEAGEHNISFDLYRLRSEPPQLHQRDILLDKDWEYQKNNCKPWRTIDLPFIINEQGYYQFRKMFTVDSATIADGYMLVARGTPGTCSVYLNKKLLGKRHAANTPLVFELTKEDLFFTDYNELILEIDNRTNYTNTVPLIVRNRGIPVLGGSLIRPLILTPLGDIFIRQVDISYDDSLRFDKPLLWQLKIKITLQLSRAISANDEVKWQVKIFEPGNATIPVCHSALMPIPATGAGQQHQTIEMATQLSMENMRFWRIRSAQLYHVSIQLIRKSEILDQIAVDVGFPEKSFLDSENVKSSEYLKVIEWIEDSKIRQLPEEALRKQIEEDLQNIFLLGADGVRIGGHAPDDYFLNVCDRLGLLVFFDLPISNCPPAILAQKNIFAQAQSILFEQIKAFNSHPCVGAWGLGSGYEISDSRAKNFIEKLYDLGKTLDSRPFYIGVRGAHQYDVWHPQIHRLHEIWLDDVQKQMAFLQKLQKGDMVQLIAPIAVAENDQRTAQLVQASNLKTMMLALGQSTNISAVIVSSYRDFIGDSPYLYWQSKQHRTGLLDINNRKRSSFDLVKAIYNKTAMPELLSIGITPEDNAIFQLIGLACIFILLFFFKRDKRFANYLKRVFVHSHGFYVDLSENRQISPFLTGLMGLIVSTTLAGILASFIFFLRRNIYFDEMLSWFIIDAEVKERIIGIIWQPRVMLLFLLMLIIVLMLCWALVIKLFIFFQRRRLRFKQIVAFVFWVPANFIFALPLLIVLLRMLERGVFISIAVGYFVFLLIWFFGRALRGLKVILQLSTIKVFMLQMIVISLLAGIFILYLDRSRSLLAYWEYYRGLINF